MFIGEDAIMFLSGENSLIDTELFSIGVKSVNGLANILMVFRYPDVRSSKFVQIKFTEILYFSFQHKCEDVFLNVWDLKFVRLDGGDYYISLDPDPSTLPSAGVVFVKDEVSDDFVVRARSVEAMIIDGDAL